MRMLPLLFALPLLGIATVSRATDTNTFANAEAASESRAPAASAPFLTTAPVQYRLPDPAPMSGAVGGPLDDSPIGLGEQLIATEESDTRQWLGTPDPSLERRYAPATEEPLNRVTIRFRRLLRLEP